MGNQGSHAPVDDDPSEQPTMRALPSPPQAGVQYVWCAVGTANDTDEGRALMAMLRVEASLAQWLPDARPSTTRARSYPFKFEDDMCDATRDTAFLAYRRVHDAYPDGRWRDHVQVARLGTHAALRTPGARVFAMLLPTPDGCWPLYFCVFTPAAKGADATYLRALWKSVHWLAARAAGHPDAPDARPPGGMRLLQWALNRNSSADNGTLDRRVEFNARRAFLRLCERHGVPLQLDLHERAHIERKQGAAVHGYALARDFLHVQLANE